MVYLRGDEQIIGQQAVEISTLFLVEDDEDTANIITLIMEREGYQIVYAAVGRAALKLIKSMPPPALVLPDIQLPYHDGVKLLSQIRLGRPKRRTVPVVMFTADNSARDVRESLALGANDYILKPFKRKTLLRRLQRSQIDGSGKPAP